MARPAESTQGCRSVPRHQMLLLPGVLTCVGCEAMAPSCSGLLELTILLEDGSLRPPHAEGPRQATDDNVSF